VFVVFPMQNPRRFDRFHDRLTATAAHRPAQGLFNHRTQLVGQRVHRAVVGRLDHRLAILHRGPGPVGF